MVSHTASEALATEGKMSDNQSWNSSGSEEDIEPREELGHHAGVADLSGVLSKVSHASVGLNFPRVYLSRSVSLPAGHDSRGGTCLHTRVK